LVLFGIVTLAVAIVGAQAPLQPTPVDGLTARIVVQLMEHGHLSKPHLDDAIAKKWCRNFIKALDPQKYYFLKADVDGFLALDTTLDDKIQAGDVTFAKTVFERFLKRSDERLATVLELLKQKPDFTLDEYIVDDPEKLDYPADEAEAKERWRKRIKLDLLQLKVAGSDEADAIKQLTIRYRDRNRNVHQFDTTDLLEVYLSSLTTTIDSHSTYMGSKTVEDLMQALHLSLEGIGASLQSEAGYAVVKVIIPGGAADRDKRLQPEDKIVGIKKDDGEEIDFVEKKLADVVRYIRGPRGTKVRLIVQPSGSKERKIIDLTREKIELKEAHAKSQIIETKTAEGKTIKVGLINLPSFYGDTAAALQEDPEAVSATRDCRKFLDDFKKAKVQVVLIDLRGNGGGLLQEAITLSGLFIHDGPVVQVREANNLRHLDDEDETTGWDGPMAVLIDHQSASASEIFAGVIRDYGRGLIIGDSSTFGKGTVQSIIPLNERIRQRNLPNLGALKLTIQQFYRANGESTQIRGVPPHLHIPSLMDQLDVGEGKMDNALKFDRVPDLPHEMYNRVPSDLLAQLQERSADRRAANPKFQKQEELIKKLIARKQRHSISLNETKFRAEYVPDEDDAEEGHANTKSAEKKDKKKRFAEHPAWESNFYNDEVMAIIGDYVTLGSKAIAAAPVRVSSH
jgi:carboxyl-terminal processing protease